MKAVSLRVILYALCISLCLSLFPVNVATADRVEGKNNLEQIEAVNKSPVNQNDESYSPQITNIVWDESDSYLRLEHSTSPKDIFEFLPASLTVYLDDDSQPVIIPVTWTIESDYVDEDITVYDFYPLIEGYSCACQLPHICVEMEDDIGRAERAYLNGNGASLSEGEIRNRIDELYNLLGGKYFNVGQNHACGSKAGNHWCNNCLTTNIVSTSWFKNLFGNVSVSQFPAHQGHNGSKYVSNTRAGYSCYGFANFAEWYIFKSSNSSTVDVKTIGYYNFDYNNISSYARVGDILRLGNSHSVILVNWDTSGITVLDSNWSGSYNCMVEKHSISYSKYSTMVISREEHMVNSDPYLSISNLQAPEGILPLGVAYGLRGIITSSHPLTLVEGAIQYASGGVVDGHYYRAENLNTTTYNIQTDGLNYALKFGDLPAGNYKYVLTVKNSAGMEENRSYSFQMGETVTPSFWLDVNGNLDGAGVGSILDYGTFDVLINTGGDWALAADDVQDFYQQYPNGTGYQITDIKASGGHAYQGLYAGSDTLSGVLGGDANVTLTFVTTGAVRNMESGTYFIASALDLNKGLEVWGYSTDASANIQLHTFHGATNQQFELREHDGYYNIVAKNSGYFLDVCGGSPEPGTNVQQYIQNGHIAQDWLFEDAGDGFFYIRSRLGTYLDVAGGVNADDINIQTWSFNGCNAQKFKLIQPAVLNVNGLLDGVPSGDLGGYGTFELYINGQLRAQGGDAWCEAPIGAAYAIRNVRPNEGYSFEGVSAGTTLGTIGGGVQEIVLDFTTIHTAEIAPAARKIIQNGKIYEFYATPVTWYTAAQFCRERGGHLATISDEAEQNLVAELAAGEYAWLGATDVDNEGTWHWVTGESFSYVNWDSGEPNDNGGSLDEDCLEIWGSGYWNDTIGSQKLCFILEREATALLDVNYLLDGEYTYAGEGFCQFDVLLNGVVDGNGVSDYCKALPVGTAYEIKNIRPVGAWDYLGYTGSLSGVIGEESAVAVLKFRRNADLGERFYAYVSNAEGTRRLGLEGEYNVALQPAANTLSQLWLFEKMEDNWYKITSAEDGRSLDVFNADTAAGTNLQVHPWHSHDAQYWGFHALNGFYEIGSRCTACIIEEEKTDSETRNARLWEELSEQNQLFSLQKLDGDTADLDVNFILDGQTEWFGQAYGTFDMIINGEKAEEDCNDYVKALPLGTTYEITDIKATEGHHFEGVSSGKLSGKAGPERTEIWLIFTSNSYAISYDANGGAGAPGAQTKTHGTALTLSGEIPSRSGYRFLGWAERADALLPDYQPGASFTKDAETILYAVWEEAAQEGTRLLGGAEIGTPGSTLRIPFTMEGNPGIASAMLEFQFDHSVLNLTSIERGTLMEEGTFNADAALGQLQWYHTSNVEGDGTLFTLVFTVADNAPEGEYSITASLKNNLAANLTNADYENVPVQFVAGTAKLVRGIPGDVTGDGVVAMGDVVKAARAVAGYVTLTAAEQSLGDVTGDGVVAMGDVVKLARYVAGYLDKLAGGLAPLRGAARNAVSREAVCQVEAVSGTPGKSVTVAVRLTQNPGIAGGMFTIDYDTSALTLTGMQAGELFKTGTFNADVEKKQLQWYSTGNITGTGTMFTLTFEITPHASAGEYAISVGLKNNLAANLTNEDYSNVPVSFKAGSVRVGGAYSLAGQRSGSAVNLTVTAAGKGETILLAAYDAAGRMTEVLSAKARAGENTYRFTLTKPAATIKAFLTGADAKPLCDGVSLK